MGKKQHRKAGSPKHVPEGDGEAPAEAVVASDQEQEGVLDPASDELAEATEVLVSEEPEPQEVVRLQEQLDEANDRYLRLAAEFDNYRKRIAREQAEARARAQGDVVRRLLEALDDLERVAGLEESDATVHDVVTGVHMVERKLQQELEVLGTERVAAEGEPFDPNFHEAIGALPVSEDAEPGTIAAVVQRGYRLGTTLLRPARVLVYVDQETHGTAGASQEA